MKRFTLAAIIGLSAIATKAQQWGDYTLYATMNGTTANLLDTNGTIFKTWNLTGKTGYSSFLTPGGTLVRTVSKTGNSFNGGPICGQVQKVDWSGNIVWDFVYSTTEYCTHHDICPMPNGNVLLIAYERRSAAETTQDGGTKNIEIWHEKIVEVQPAGATTGTVVWEWRTKDHLCQNVDPTKDNYVTSISDHPELLNINYKNQKDWLHMNGVDYNPIKDQIVWSSHNTNEWYVIDHSTTTAEAASHSGGNSGKGGDILYRWGNPAAYSASGNAILKITHDAHWIPEGCPNAGYLVGFNNQGVSTSKSSVDQVDPPDSSYWYKYAAGSAFTPTTYDLRHACNGYTSNMGNSQQLPNGNMLVCIALSGSIYEVDPNGTTIWSKTITGMVPQAFRYSKCYTDNAAPTTPTIVSNGTDLNSSTAATYQWYVNGEKIAGATSQTYTPTQSGNYLVRTTDANGCVFVYSTAAKFIASGNIGLVKPANLSAITIYPNPSTGMVNIDFNGLQMNTILLEVFDATGRKNFTGKNTNQVDLSTAENGIYYLVISAENAASITKKISVIK